MSQQGTYTTGSYIEKAIEFFSGSNVFTPNPSNHGESVDNWKLIIDRFEETFDYLPLKGLIAVGEICDRLQQVAGYCFQKNYSGIEVDCKDNHIVIDGKHQADLFVRFIKKLCIHSEEDFEYFLSVQSNLQHLKRIELEHIKINGPEIESLRNNLVRVESLRLEGCALPSHATFHETVLEFFPNLKHLCVVRIPRESTIIGVNNKWLRLKFPTLEHFELVIFGDPVIPELRTFLELNPKIKTFFTFARFFWANRLYMLDANVKLNELVIYINYDNWTDFSAFCDLLHKLYECGFYERLHLQYFCCTTNQDFIDEMASLSALTKLFVNIKSEIRVGAFPNLEELFIDTSEQIVDFEAIPFKLPKLKRIRFTYSNVDHICMLICRAVRLKKIIVNNIVDKISSKRVREVVINLSELNMEREKLSNAQKVTLFVPEDSYLATKWAMKHTNLKLLRLCRVESFEQDNHYNLFGYNPYKSDYSCETKLGFLQRDG